MALEPNFEDSLAESPKQQWKSQTAAEDRTSDGYFDCNICLDSLRDPVVTLCGHVYCWPCIYKWLSVQSSPPDAGENQKCPVCKASISPALLVPLYGRGTDSSPEPPAKMPNSVPRRPNACGVHTLNASSTASSSPELSQASFHPPHQYLGHPYTTAVAPAGVLNPTAGMFGAMIYARIFGGSDASLLTYPYQNPYQVGGGHGRPRTRREEKSLTRVSLFISCCLVLCFVLF